MIDLPASAASAAKAATGETASREASTAKTAKATSAASAFWCRNVCAPWAKCQGVRVVLPCGNLHPQVYPLDI